MQHPFDGILQDESSSLNLTTNSPSAASVPDGTQSPAAASRRSFFGSLLGGVASLGALFVAASPVEAHYRGGRSYGGGYSYGRSGWGGGWSGYGHGGSRWNGGGYHRGHWHYGHSHRPGHWHGGRQVTTYALGEEGSGGGRVTTYALGEEGRW